MNINEVLEALRANKVKRHNHEGASRRLGSSHQKGLSRSIGKLKGHCPHCGLMITMHDANGKGCITCPRCNYECYHDDLHKVRKSRYPEYCHAPWGNPECKAK